MNMMIIDDRRTISSKFLVRLWHWVTVASLARSIAATGFPTMSLRPSTTALVPAIGTPVASNKAMHPDGVHGENKGVEAREDKWPILYA